MYRSEKLRKSVQEMECQLCGRFGHTVPAHANWQQCGKGMGLKAHDIFIAAVCDRCHDTIDGRAGKLTDGEKHDLWQKAWIQDDPVLVCARRREITFSFHFSIKEVV